MAILTALSTVAWAQCDVWYFGQGISIDFSGGTPVPTTGHPMLTWEAAAMGCDPVTGALLFYTNGETVYNRNHAVMPNGTGLAGHISSVQGALVVPMPCDSTKYYIFTTDQSGYWGPPHRGFHYSLVDMALDNGLGDIATKNVRLQPRCSEHLTAVAHANGSDYWVIAHSLGRDTFYVYRVTSAGVSNTPIISVTGAWQGTPEITTQWPLGYLKSSPDGRRLAIACGFIDMVELYDFDPATGIISNPLAIESPRLDPLRSVNDTYGLGFSADNSKLYYMFGQDLMQVDLNPYNLAAITASRTVLVDPAYPMRNGVHGGMQMGPDGKIYTVTEQNWLGVINSPNNRGQACNFQVRSVPVTAVVTTPGLPNIIEHRASRHLPRPITLVGPATACDSALLAAPSGLVSYRWSTGAPDSQIVARRSGLYSLEAVDSFGCTSTGSIIVRIGETPRIQIVPTRPLTFCEGDSTTIVARPDSALYGYRWSTGDTVASITVRTGGRYTVTVTGTGGCGTSASVDVVANPRPPLTISAQGAARFCQGDSLALSASTGYARYLWSTGDTGRTIVVRAAGSYSVRGTNPTGCAMHSDTIAVAVDPIPIPSITGPIHVCWNTDASYGTAARPGARYEWKVGGNGIILSGELDPNLAVRWGLEGTGTVSLTTIDSSGCRSDSTIMVTIDSLLKPLVATSRSPRLCIGDSVLLDAGEYARYRWSTGDTTRTIVVRTAGRYLVDVAGVDGCSGASDPIEVTIAPDPSPIIIPSGATAFCRGEDLDLDAGPGYREYLWSTGQTTRSITVDSAGSYEVTVVDSSGCTGSSAPLEIRVEEPPAPVIQGPTEVCRNSTVAYTAPATAGHSYQWVVTGGTIVAGQGSAAISVRWDGGPAGTVELIEMSAGGCTGRAPSLAVAIGDRLKPAISPVDPVVLCPGESVVLDAGPGYAKYLWSNGATTRTITVSDSGSHAVHAETADGCGGESDTVHVTVRPALLVRLAPRGPIELCGGDSVVLATAGAFARYRWSTGSGAPSLVVRESGRYWVEITDAFGCSARSDTADVTVHPPPVAAISVLGALSFCEGDSTALEATNAAARYLWSTGDTTRRIIVKTTGRYSLRVVDGNGCAAGSDTVAVTAHPAPDPPTIFTAGRSLATGAGFRYQWMLDGVLLADSTARAITPSKDGRYTVMIIDSNGCRAASESFLFTAIAPRPHMAWIDTVSGRVGEPLRLTMRVAPALEASEGIESYRFTLKVEPRSLYALRSAAAGPVAGAGPALVGGRDGSIAIDLAAGGGSLVGAELFYLDVVGLVTAVPANPVRIESAELMGEGPIASKDGLVLLSGCDIGSGLALDKPVAIRGVMPNPSNADAIVLYRAPLDSYPRLKVIDATGRSVMEIALAVGTGADQEARLDVGALPTGLYRIELHDRAERAAVPIVVVH